jgi:hypothetical protein
MKQFLLEWVGATSIKAHIDEVVDQLVIELDQLIGKESNFNELLTMVCYEFLHTVAIRLGFRDLEKALCKLIKINFSYPCTICNKAANKLCSRCQDNSKCPVYCSRECQKVHWKHGHKAECKPFIIEEESYEFEPIYRELMISIGKFMPSDIDLMFMKDILTNAFMTLIGSFPIRIFYDTQDVTCSFHYVTKYANNIGVDHELVYEFIKALANQHIVKHSFYQMTIMYNPFTMRNYLFALKALQDKNVKENLPTHNVEDMLDLITVKNKCFIIVEEKK